jgi:hypothetical protein
MHCGSVKPKRLRTVGQAEFEPCMEQIRCERHSRENGNPDFYPKPGLPLEGGAGTEKVGG